MQDKGFYLNLLEQKIIYTRAVFLIVGFVEPENILLLWVIIR